MNRLRPPRIIVAVAALAAALAGAAPALANRAFYQTDVVAKTGDAVNVGGTAVTLTSFGHQVSINNFGVVAFNGKHAGGQGIFVWDGPGSPPRNINPAYSNSLATRFFSEDVQINDHDDVLAIDKVPSSPNFNLLRIWAGAPGAAPNTAETMAKAGGLCTFPTPDSGCTPLLYPEYAAVLDQVSLSNNRHVAFSALGIANSSLAQAQLATGNAATRHAATVQGPFRPMVADNGTVVLRAGNTGTSPIRIYDYGLSAPTDVACAAGAACAHPGFTDLGQRPGISDDGSVVSFYGNVTAAAAPALGTTPGPGIFLSIDTTLAPRKLVRVTGGQAENTTVAGGNGDGVCDAGETCRPAAELGVDASGAPISFASYSADVRIGVLRTDLPLGSRAPNAVPNPLAIDGDSIVVSFIATPSAAGRTSAALGGPLLFSAQRGVFTARVDVNRNFDVPTLATTTYYARSPIPVVQVGDTVNGMTVDDLQLWDSIGHAEQDGLVGPGLPARRGNNRIVYWAHTTAGGEFIARATYRDSDEDGLPDHWESQGIDVNGDGTIDLNLPAMGAQPLHRDLFLEEDWIAPRSDGINPPFRYSPAPGVTASLVAMFAAAPATTSGIAAGITLHVDAGSGNDSSGTPYSANMSGQPLQGGDGVTDPAGPIDVAYFGRPWTVPVPGIVARDLDGIKQAYFASGNAGARELAFHYSLSALSWGLLPVAGGGLTGAVAGADNNAFDLNGDGVNETRATLRTPVPFGTNPGGHMLKVTGGPGAGQIRSITGLVAASRLGLDRRWTTIPTAASTYSILQGSSGIAETWFRPNPDRTPVPGNDELVTLGGFGINAGGWLANRCIQWRTYAHELGHTLGLRHGGTDHIANKPNYNSLMSYTWQMSCPAGAAMSPVQSYSGAGDSTFNDWDNLMLDYQSSFVHVTNSFNASGFGDVADGLPDAAGGDDEGYTFVDYQAKYGPVDLEPPTLTLRNPPIAVRVGKQLTITVAATDDTGVGTVQGTFDANGDGEPETVDGVQSAPGVYTLTFPETAAPQGDRTLTVVAADGGGNEARQTAQIIVKPGDFNSAPRVADASAETDEDTPVTVELSAVDPEGDPVAIAPVDQPAHGTLGPIQDGVVRYTPDANYNGPDSFTYNATDGALISGLATVTLTVHAVNDAPVVHLLAAGPFPEASAAATLTAVASDVEGDPISYSWSTTGGELVGNGPTATFRADDGPLAAAVTVTTDDGHGGVSSDTQTVQVANVAPWAAAGPAQTQYWGLPLTFAGAAGDVSPIDAFAGLAGAWSFGDQTPGADAFAASHVYAAPGSYAAAFTATDKDGGSTTNTAAVTVKARGSSLAYTGSTTAPYGFARLSARLGDAVDGATGQLAGRRVTFTAGTLAFAANTDEAGNAVPVLATPIGVGTYAVATRFAADPKYTASTAPTATLRVTSSVGSARGTGVVAASNGAAASFSVSSTNGSTIVGSLSYGTLSTTMLAPFGVAPDGHSAWFNGVTASGVKLVVYAEDNGASGDVFKLWQNGVLQTGTGALSAGDVVISR